MKRLVNLSLQKRPMLRQRLSVAVLVCSAVLVSLWTLDRLYPVQLPSDMQLFAHVVTDNSGRPLRAFPDAKGVWRYPIALDDVSPLYIEALLNYEDRTFWYHPGFDPLAFGRALAQAIFNGHVVSGGSTLTMQVARLLHPHARTVPGKLYQVARALQLEWHLSKRDILQLYLNIAPFGGTVEGVQAASYAYLDKPANALTHGEAALLAVLPQSPTRIRPDRNPQQAQTARDKVLKRMAKLDVWDQRTVDDAMQETVYAHELRPPQNAPLLASTLVQRHSDSAVIHSTVDGDLQRNLEEYIGRYRTRLPLNSSMAVLVVDNRDMGVRAYIGAADFGNQDRFGYLDMVQALRSPGSTLKPFLYGMALEQGLIHSESLLSDVPRSGSRYRPGNFSGGFSGPVSVSEALQRSLNVPAVSLLEQFGAQRFAGRLANAGLPLSLPGDKPPGLAIILGGAGVTLDNLVGAYSALARGGLAGQLRYRDVDPLQERYLLDPGSAWITWQMLQATPRPGHLHTLQQTRERGAIAWKTGTSYGFRDAWSVGVSKTFTVGVWVGRPDGTPMPGHFGAETAAPLMFDIFQQLNDDGAGLPQPANVAQADICWPLGTAASRNAPAHCEQRRTAWILNNTIPPTLGQGRNPLPLWVDQDTGNRVTPLCAGSDVVLEQIALWPAAMEPWLPGSKRRNQRIPTLDGACGEDQALLLSPPRIVGVEDGARMTPSVQQARMPELSLSVAGGVGELQWYINGAWRYSSKANQAVHHRFDTAGRYEIVVVDEQGQTDRRTVSVEHTDLAYY